MRACDGKDETPSREASHGCDARDGGVLGVGEGAGVAHGAVEEDP